MKTLDYFVGYVVESGGLSLSHWGTTLWSVFFIFYILPYVYICWLMLTLAQLEGVD